MEQINIHYKIDEIMATTSGSNVVLLGLLLMIAAVVLALFGRGIVRVGAIVTLIAIPWAAVLYVAYYFRRLFWFLS